MHRNSADSKLAMFSQAGNGVSTQNRSAFESLILTPTMHFRTAVAAMISTASLAGEHHLHRPADTHLLLHQSKSPAADLVASIAAHSPEGSGKTPPRFGSGAASLKPLLQGVMALN